MSIELALKACIPLISTDTTDLLNLKDNLKRFKPKSKNLDTYKEGQKIQRNFVYYVLGCIENNLLDIYKELVHKDSSLIVVNPIEKNTMYFDVGTLPTNKRLLIDTLSEFMSASTIKDILPSLGGLTLKEIVEILMITEAKFGSVSADLVMKTRLNYLQPVQGLEIVNTDIDGYNPYYKIQHFIDNNKKFFLNDYDPRLRPRGLLVHGVPGTGKTCGAKYLAKEWGIPLFKLDATIQSKWLGQSESNLIQALKRLEELHPCVLIIDEVEKLFSNSADQGATSKLLGTLLWWLQEHTYKIFTYMTCNDLSSVPAELYRKGRIDELIELPLLNALEATQLQDIIADSFNEADCIQFKKRKDVLVSAAEVNADVIQAIKDSINKKEL